MNLPYINMRDRWGRTALDDANEECHEEIQEILLKAGALPGIDDSDPTHWSNPP